MWKKSLKENKNKTSFKIVVRNDFKTDVFNTVKINLRQIRRLSFLL